MRVILPTLVSMAVLAALSIHSAPNAENWRHSAPTVLRVGRPSLRRRLASGPLARLAGRVVVETVRTQ
jgi:hypothetical protein